MVALNVAMPEEFKLFEPMTVEPTEKFIVPVGVAAPALCVTVAINVTLCPTVAGFGEAVRLSVVVFLTTNVAKPDSTPPQVSANV